MIPMKDAWVEHKISFMAIFTSFRPERTERKFTGCFYKKNFNILMKTCTKFSFNKLTLNKFEFWHAAFAIFNF